MIRFMICFLYAGFALSLYSSCLSPLADQEALPGQAQQEAPDTAPVFIFKELGLTASLEWVKMQTDDEHGEFVLRFWDSATGSRTGPYVTPEDPIYTYLWMKMGQMDHGAGPIRTEVFKDEEGKEVPGVFRCTGVFFTMNGKWQIHVRLHQGDSEKTKKDEAVIEYVYTR